MKLSTTELKAKNVEKILQAAKSDPDGAAAARKQIDQELSGMSPKEWLATLKRADHLKQVVDRKAGKTVGLDLMVREQHFPGDTPQYNLGINRKDTADGHSIKLLEIPFWTTITDRFAGGKETLRSDYYDGSGQITTISLSPNGKQIDQTHHWKPELDVTIDRDKMTLTITKDNKTEVTSLAPPVIVAQR